MPALTDIRRYKLLAEVFVLAIRLDPSVIGKRQQAAVNALMAYHLSERQAEQFVDTAMENHRRGMLRPLDEILRDMAASFRQRDHLFVLGQIAAVLEADELHEWSQPFYDTCTQFLFDTGD